METISIERIRYLEPCDEGLDRFTEWLDTNYPNYKELTIEQYLKYPYLTGWSLYKKLITDLHRQAVIDSRNIQFNYIFAEWFGFHELHRQVIINSGITYYLQKFNEELVAKH